MTPSVTAPVLLVLSTTAAAQGVPTLDGTMLGQWQSKLAAMGQDQVLQSQKLDTKQTIADIEQEQLDVLARLTEALRGKSLLAPLEGGSWGPATAAAYPSSMGPMDSRLFGEGRETVEKMIVEVAQEYAGEAAAAGLSPTQFRCLFQALVKQESRFSVGARSPVGAIGLAQLMPGTASDLGVNPYDPKDNLRGGARYITTQLKRFGNIPHALAAYNAGPGAVLKYGGVPPYKETQGYVRHISKYYNEYLSRIGGVDALGTLTPTEYGLAEYSNTSDASSYYGAAHWASIDMVVERLSAIIRQIDAQPNAVAAMELNTYARAEMGRILTMRARMKAADQVRQAAHAQHLVADRLAERTFARMEVSK